MVVDDGLEQDAATLAHRLYGRVGAGEKGGGVAVACLEILRSR